MSDHNNIYNIMSKLDALKPAPETPKQAAERIYESVEAKGSILEGVTSVEQTLSEKYQGFKKTVTAIKKSGTADNPEAVAAAIGRKKYGKAAFQKAAAAGKKMGESEQGVTEGMDDTVYPNAQVIKSKNGKPVGEIYQDGNSWGCFHYRADRGYDGIDSREDAIAALKDLHQEIGRSRPDYTIKGVAETVDMEEGKVANARVNEIRQLAKDFFGENPYSSAVIAGGKFLRLSFPVSSFLFQPKGIKRYRYEPMSSITPEDQQAIKGLVGRFQKFMAKHGVGKDEFDMKFHIGAYLYASVRIAIPQEQPMEEERETLKTKHGTIYKGGTYGTDYDGDDAPKKPKHVPKTGQKGRPKKEKPAEYSKTNDPFGRVPDTAPKGKKGTVIKGKGNQDTVDEGRSTVGAMVLESVNFKKMMDECDMTMAEMLECIDQDIRTYKTTGDMTDRLRDFMHLHNHAKKQMEENRPVPYEVPAVQRRAAGAAPLTPGDVQAQDAARSMHPGMTKLDAPKPAVHDELDELAKLAGITDEGNAFTGKLASTPKGGEFELDSNTFKDTSSLDESMCNECGMYESQCSCQEGNLFTKHLKDTPDGGEFEIDGKKYKDTSSLEEMARLAGIFQEGKDYGDTTYNEPPTYDNTPDEQVQDEDVLLRGGDGEVAGMEKKMNKDGAARFSDNPLAMQESKDLIKPAAEFDYVEAMGRKLMQAYEGIKAK